MKTYQCKSPKENRWEKILADTSQEAAEIYTEECGPFQEVTVKGVGKFTIHEQITYEAWKQKPRSFCRERSS